MKINDLPKPYQDLIRKRSNPMKQLEQPLISAFGWADTPEGHAFWMAVDMAKTVDELPPIPKQEAA
jgi:hypothetical protein